nr:sugar transferase [Propionibacterium sp.]
MTVLQEAGQGVAQSRPRWSVRNHRDRLLAAGLVAADAVVVLTTAVVAVFLRDELPVFRPTLDVAENVLPWAAALVGVWMLSLFIGGAYRARSTGVGTREYTTVLVWSLIAAGAVAIALYLSSYNLSRGFFLLFFGFGTPALILERFLIRRVVNATRARGHFPALLLIAGATANIEGISKVLQRERWLGYRVVGALPSEGGDAIETPSGIPVVGVPVDALAAVESTGAHAVLFAEGSFSQPADFNEMARQLEAHNVQMIVVPTLTDIAAGRLAVRPVAGMPLVFVEEPRARRAGSWAKRAFDVVGASLLIVLSAPVMLAVAWAISVEDGGPVLFRQRRIGLKGEEFDCYKFRSMSVDAERHLAELQEANVGAGVLFKVKDDPRVTRVGRVLRRFSLDELPQFFNVLSGRMSLVGPRPALPSEVARYPRHVLRRLDVRPGITGLWQVSGRSDLSWDETVRLDLYYVDNWSMLQDLNILGRTFGAVVRSRGAY